MTKVTIDDLGKWVDGLVARRKAPAKPAPAKEEPMPADKAGRRRRRAVELGSLMLRRG
jgi:hypothetical protein